MGAIYNNARHTRIFHPEERRADRNCMPIFARVRTAHEGETGWERIERDEQVKGKRPRTRTGVYSAGTGREKDEVQRGRKTRRRDLLLGIYCYYPEGEDHSATGNGDAYGVGCVYPIRAVRARTLVLARVYTMTHTYTYTPTYGCRAHRWDEPTSVHPVS